MGDISDSDRSREMTERGVTPIDPYPGSGVPWKCRCQRCLKIVTPRYYTVVKSGKGGCDFCAKKDAGSARRKEAEKRYLEAAKRMSLEPLEDFPGALEDWLLKCLQCGEAKKRRAQSVMVGRGCKPCQLKKRMEEKRLVDKARADALFISHRVQPTGEFTSWKKAYLGKCQVCGSSTRSSPSRVERGAGACFTCSRLVSGKTRRDNNYSPQEAAKVMLEAGCLVDDVNSYRGKAFSWPGVCVNCGLKTKSTLNRVLNGTNPCKHCAMSEADSAFDYFGPALLYFLENTELAHYKIGIMGTQTKRMQAHTGRGWVVLETWEFDYGYEANFVEQYALEKIRDSGISNRLTPKDMPQGGHSETFVSSQISKDEVLEIVSEEIETERWPIPKVFVSGEKTRKPRRTCTVIEDGVQCEEKYSAKGCCRRHYLALRTHGDPTFRQRELFTNETCQIVDGGDVCGDVTSRKGMCSKHYYRDYEFGDPLFSKRPTPQPRIGACSRELCHEPDVSLGLCSRHYNAKVREDKRRKDGRPEPLKYESDLCKVETCKKARTSLGFCHNHYTMNKKYGDPKGGPRGPIHLKTGSCASVECNKPDEYKGLCKSHYNREYKRKRRGSASLLD